MLVYKHSPFAYVQIQISSELFRFTFNLGSSQEIQDRLVLLDIFTDIFCMVFPLLYTSTWLSFCIPVLIPQMLLIVVYPTLSLDRMLALLEKSLQRCESCNSNIIILIFSTSSHLLLVITKYATGSDAPKTQSCDTFNQNWTDTIH